MAVVGRGLSVDGINYFADFVSEGTEKTPNWMEFGQQIAKLSGNYKILDFVTGFEGLQEFAFRTPKWPIGGMYFDGIMRTEHVSRVRPTQYPVQTGVTMTDHAIVEPAELTIDVMMTDTATDNLASGNMLGDFVANTASHVFGQGVGDAIKVYNSLQNMDYSNFGDISAKPGGVTQAGNGRSAKAWEALKAMQLARAPITVETRLQTYSNMLIEELSAPDDYMTLNALKCTVRLREIIFAGVAETKVSARAAATADATKSGQQPVTTGDGPKKTALKAGLDAGGSILGG